MTATMTYPLTAPRFDPVRRLSQEWIVLPAWLPIPDMGALAANAFLLQGHEPMLVDTGIAALEPSFLSALEREIDLPALRWIWLSHADADHIGNLGAILERAPHAKIVTTFLGAGKLGLMGFDPSRAHVVMPGDTISIGEQRLTALRPPYFDAPESLGFFDQDTRTLFAVDSFGALLPGPTEQLSEVTGDVLDHGLSAWSTLDAPWLEQVDPGLFDRSLNTFEQLKPTRILTSHLPSADSGGATRLFDCLSRLHLNSSLPAWTCGTSLEHQ